MNLDIATVIAASLAAIAAIYNIKVSKIDSQKKDMLNNLTSERIDDLHKIKECSNVILSEATVVIHISVNDKEEKIRNVIAASNELWFIFKPVYYLDCEVLYSLKDLVDTLVYFYKNDCSVEDTEIIERIIEKRDSFRQNVFLYVYSSWTCIKHQILDGEKSGYTEFEKVYAANKARIAELKEGNEFRDFYDILKL